MQAGTRRGDSSAGVGLGEVLLVFALYALVAAAIFVTYALVPARDLYHVTESGLDGGAGRALVFLNFSAAVAAVATLPLALAHLPGRLYAAAGVLSLLLCGVVAVPGVVDEADLDPRWVNVLPALGVAVAIGLAALAVRAVGGARLAARRPGDGARAVLVCVLFVVSVPWVLADLGIAIGSVPVLGGVFLSEELWAPFGEARVKPAVHLGHHHGLDGFLLAFTALALSRPLAQLRNAWLRSACAFYLSLMLVYGLSNVADDAWLEQLVKRGTTSWAVPSILEPRPSLAWGVVLLLAAGVWLVAFRNGPARAGRALPHAGLGAFVLASSVATLTVLGAIALETGGADERALGVQGGIAFPMVDKRYDIFVLAEGSLRNVSDDPGRDVAPSWAPDGRMLAFQSDRGGNADVYVVRADGAGLRRLTDNAGSDGEPAWSPDGRRIAFVTARGGDRDVYVMDADGSRQRPLAAGPGDEESPSWSPDGRTLVFSSNRAGDHDLYVVGADGTSLRRLTSGPGDDRSASWSPDGRLLVFASDRRGDYDLYFVSADGTGLRRLTRGVEGDFAPSFSPDGREIVFVSDRAGRDQLFTVDAAGGAPRQLTAEPRDKDRPSWVG